MLGSTTPRERGVVTVWWDTQSPLSTDKNQREKSWFSVQFLLFLRLKIWTHQCATHIQGGLPSSGRPFWKHWHGHSYRYVPMMKLNLIMSTIKDNHHNPEPNLQDDGKCCLKNVWLVRQALDRRNTWIQKQGYKHTNNARGWPSPSGCEVWRSHITTRNAANNRKNSQDWAQGQSPACHSNSNTAILELSHWAVAIVVRPESPHCSRLGLSPLLTAP